MQYAVHEASVNWDILLDRRITANVSRRIFSIDHQLSPASRTTSSRSPRGRTQQNKIVIFDGDAARMTGQLLDIHIEDSTGFTLYGSAL